MLTKQWPHLSPNNIINHVCNYITLSQKVDFIISLRSDQKEVTIDLRRLVRLWLRQELRGIIRLQGNENKKKTKVTTWKDPALMWIKDITSRLLHCLR